MKVSCIMANYNTDHELLLKAINSILTQSFRDFELIIVDDASTDDSLTILKNIQNENKNVRVLINKNNSGLAYSLNKAIRAANGEYIARMDTDDISLPNRFEVQVNYLDKNRDIDICGSFAKVFGEYDYYSFNPFFSADDCKCHLLCSACLIHPTVMMRKKFIVDNQLFYNEKYRCSQDFELWARCADVGKIEMIDQVLLLYRVHKGQISIQKKELQRNYAKEICRKQLAKLTDDITDDNMNTHLILCGHAAVDEANIKDVVIWISYVINLNLKTGIYKQRNLKIIMFNKLFNFVLKSEMPYKNKIKILLQNKDLISIQNIYSLLYRAIFTIRNNMCKSDFDAAMN